MFNIVGCVIMKINFSTELCFQRRLTPKEEAEYSDVLKQAKSKVGNQGKSILIVPFASLPENDTKITGMGNAASKESADFFEFAKKYWGINEIQFLPIGQYHLNNGHCPVYSGSSMDFGNHVINIEDFASKEQLERIVKANNIKDKVNFKNIILPSSAQEQVVKEIYESMPDSMKSEFEKFKADSPEILKRKNIFRALRDHYFTYDLSRWEHIDANLFNESVVSLAEREKRLAEIKSKLGKEIDLYEFKQFLAQKSFDKAKNNLHSKGLKVTGDMLTGFSYDEVWAMPKAFIKNSTIDWGLPALNGEAPEAEAMLREKVRFYAKNFDGIRVDASWTYVEPNVHDNVTGIKTKKNYGDKLLNIIDNEFRKIKGSKYNKSDIIHEFVANIMDFDIYSGSRLKPFVEDRLKIYTSDGMSSDSGSNSAFLKMGWDKNSFIVGARNHDSAPIEVVEEQVNLLSKILNIEPDKLRNKNEFVKAKLAEPMSAYHNFMFFMDALGLKGRYKDNSDKTLDYTTKIKSTYQDDYFRALERSEGFNPMDALEKSFVAQGLDKKESALFKKIVKYRKILQEKESSSKYKKIGLLISVAALLLAGGVYIYAHSHKKEQHML